ncbi:hypothetical protein EDD11_001795 [Mortierella claussenii]|nr:hypothetical protein EDD11_001795 [Mortierella claussenii]
MRNRVNRDTTPPASPLIRHGLGGDNKKQKQERMLKLGKRLLKQHKMKSESSREQKRQELVQDVPAHQPPDLSSPDVKKLGIISKTLPKTPLPFGLKSSKDLNSEQLQKIIDDFHRNETRTDVLTQLPMQFESQKSIFGFLYTINIFMDPAVELPGCPVVSTPTSPDDTAFGLVWECKAGNFCAAPNASVPCLPGFYCPANTAQPTLCCQGYLCSSDATTIEVCPEGFFCPIATTKALPCNFLAFCPRGTATVEKYGLGAIMVGFALCVMGIFAVKRRIFRAQRMRYRQRLHNLGNNGENFESEKRRQKEVADLAQSIILEDQKNISGSQVFGTGSRPDPVAGHCSLALTVAAPGNKNVNVMAIPKADRSFDIRFEKLGLTLPTGVDIIKNISGRLISGRTCAVMGPSGTGKTTFLSILAGKVAKTDGRIVINGKEQPLSLWKKLIGFVPQEDVMLTELTVREILMHSARMRQSVHMSHNEKRLKVLEVIQFLGIGHIMDNPIGDIETRGVSGGERKRVNIGMELVASPSILFLDEPTSGLDSATSLEVCKLLKQIAQEQFLTVAAVVHSPSPHAFNQFDDLLLLGAGGRVVYSGPRDEAVDYFKSIGYPIPNDESPADFFISLAAGRVQEAGPRLAEYDNQDNDPGMPRYDRQESSRVLTPQERTNELFIRWEQYCANRTMAKTLEKHAIRENETMMTVRLSNDGSNQGSSDKEDSLKHTGLYPNEYDDSVGEDIFGDASSTDQESHISTMALHQPFRSQSPTYSVPISNLAGSSHNIAEYDDRLNDSRTGFLSAIRLSLISTWADMSYWFKDIADEFSRWLWSIKCRFTKEEDPVRETPSFGTVFILCFKRACLQNYRSQLDFLSDQALHISCGLCVSFASRDMIYIPRQPAEICAMAPPSIQLSCATPVDDVRYVGMFIALGVYFAGINVGACTFGEEKAVFRRDTSAGMPTLPYYLAKVLADVPRIIVASGTGMSLAWALVFSGAAPHLYLVMTSSGYTYVRWIWNVSAPRWAIEAFYLKEMEFRNYNEIEHNSLVDMYAFDHYQNAILNMVYISLGWNIIAFALMKLLDRHKVK